MADDVKEIEVESVAEVSLSLHIGGSFPYKAQLYEYTAAGGEPKPAGAELQGTAVVTIGKVAKGTVRRFVWAVVVVSHDDEEKTVDIAGHVVIATKTIGTVKGTAIVKKPQMKCFVNVKVKGKGP
jgi:hypothetical protein